MGQGNFTEDFNPQSPPPIHHIAFGVLANKCSKIYLQKPKAGVEIPAMRQQPALS